jgi:hypothetical protein
MHTGEDASDNGYDDSLAPLNGRKNEHERSKADVAVRSFHLKTFVGYLRVAI